MNRLTRIAIVDDCQDDVNNAISQLNRVQLSPTLENSKLEFDCYLNPVDFLKKQQHYDFVLLDVDMPQMNGFDVAARLNLAQPKCLIIFLTQHNERANQGFKVRTHRYITKKIDKADFDEAIISAMKEIQSVGSIVVTKGARSKSLELEKILYFTTVGKESIATTTDNQVFFCNLSLKALAERLPTWLFFRISKQSLINLEYYDSVDKTQKIVFLNCDGFEKSLKISERKLKNLDDMLHLYRKMKGRR